MIFNGILLVIERFLTILLLPLEGVNFGINALLGINYVRDFIAIVTYVLPWNNLIPIISIIVALFGLRIIIALIKTIWDLIPIL